MSDRQLTAAGIRRGLVLWPDANHWCQHILMSTGPDGEQQRCTQQMLIDGLGLQTTDSRLPNFYRRSETYMVAEAEIIRVADARNIPNFGSICALNNFTDFATMKSIVEDAALNLEKTQ